MVLAWHTGGVLSGVGIIIITHPPTSPLETPEAWAEPLPPLHLLVSWSLVKFRPNCLPPTWEKHWTGRTCL